MFTKATDFKVMGFKSIMIQFSSLMEVDLFASLIATFRNLILIKDLQLSNVLNEKSLSEKVKFLKEEHLFFQLELSRLSKSDTF